MSVAENVLDRIEAIWEALTPPDRTDVTYRREDSKRTLIGSTSAARTFRFDFPRRELSSQQAESQLVEWATIARFALDEGGRNRNNLEAAAANELHLLANAIEYEPDGNWPAGTVSVITGEAEVEVPDDGGDPTATIEISMTTWET